MNWKIYHNFNTNLNSIENLWGIIKMEYTKVDDKKDFIETVKEACNQISEDTVFNLF